VNASPLKLRMSVYLTLAIVLDSNNKNNNRRNHGTSRVTIVTFRDLYGIRVQVMNNRSSNNNNSSSNNNNNIQSEISRSGDDYPYVVKNRTIAQSSSLGDNAGGSTGRAETKEEKKKKKKEK